MTNYKRKSYKRKSNSRTSKTKGGCGCSSQNILSGGAKNTIKGGDALGPASLTNFDSTNQYTYPYFNVNNDPTNPNQVIDTRQLPNPPISGGKNKSRSNNRKSKKNKRRSYRRIYKKYKGGSDQVLQNYGKNMLSSSNTVMGSYTGANIVSANTTDTSNTFSTPNFL